MPTDDRSLVERIRAACPLLGATLSTVSAASDQRAPRSVSLEQLLSETGEDGGAQQQLLEGALAILYAMGVVRLGADDVAASSRNAAYLVGSLSRFLEQSVQAIAEPHDRLHEHSRLTQVYETARLRWHRAEEVDQEPLHRCHVVNVVIKGEMIRDWQRTGVYLHVYHPEWKAYHLIGLGVDEAGEPSEDRDKEVAKEALRRHLHLDPNQYELDDALHPRVPPLTRISGTSGAYTRYTYGVVVAKLIRPLLRRNGHLRDEHGSFRWFTRDEIQQERSSQGEAILFSTPHVMRSLELDTLPIGATRAEDVRVGAGIQEELGRRFTRQQLLIIPIMLVVLLGVQSLPWLLTQLGRSNPFLDNLANLSQIAYVAVTLAGSGLVAAAPGLLQRRRN